VLESSLRVADRDPEMTPGQVPAALKASLHALYRKRLFSPTLL